MGDVAAKLHAIEAHRRQQRVGGLARARHRRAERRRAQYPAAAGQHGTVEFARAGVENLPRQCAGGLQPFDRHAGLGLVRVATGGEHHADGRARIPVALRVSQTAVKRRLDEVDEIGAQPHQHRLRFGIAETAIELEYVRRAVVGDHQAGVEKAAIARTGRRQGPDRRQHHLAHRPLVDRGGDDRRGRVRAHAARVRTEVAVAQALVILGGGERQHGLAVDQRDEACFLALQETLDDDLAAGAAELAVEHRPHGSFGLLVRLGDDDALAGGEAVGLDDERHALRPDPAGVEGGGGEDPIGRRRDAVAGHEVLGIGFRALEARGRGGRAEAGEARGAERIDHAVDQRPLGSDNGQVDALGAGVAQQAVDVVGGDRYVADPRFAGGAGIAWRDVHGRDAWRPGDFPGEGVFTAAAADDQYAHAQCRKWRRPV